MTHLPFTVLAFCLSFTLLPALAATSCKPEVSVPQALLQQRVVVFGELHGTQETPRLVGECACLLVSRGTEVVIALEIPEPEQARITEYLSSAGTSGDARALLQGEFWSRPDSRQDGRSSVAMFELIERVRQLSSTSERISVVAIDGQRKSLTRDAAMAQIVRDHIKNSPEAHVLALVGNIHALKDRGAFFDKDYASFTFHLSSLEPLALNVVPKRGSAWVCIEGCGSRSITAPAWVAGKLPGVYVGTPEADPRYHGAVVLEQAQASPPARAR